MEMYYVRMAYALEFISCLIAKLKIVRQVIKVEKEWKSERKNNESLLNVGSRLQSILTLCLPVN